MKLELYVHKIFLIYDGQFFLLCSCAGVKVGGDDICPVIYLLLVEPGNSREKDEQLLQTVANECMEKGVAMATSKYLKEEFKLPPPRWVWSNLSLIKINL